MIKETLVLIALALGQTPSIVDDHTVRIVGVSVRLIDFATPEPKCPRKHALAWQAKRELRALLILAEAGALKMAYKFVPCDNPNYGQLCATTTIDGKPLAPKTDWCRAHSPPQHDPRSGRLWWVQTGAGGF
jgi:hypothetical protein